MSYLFASIPWNETAKEWHTLKNREKKFLKEVFLKIGHCPSALLAAGKLLNEIGSTFIEDGIGWISEMINENPELFDNPLKTNTRYYMENLLKKYIFENRERIKRNQRTKDNLLTILNFLIEKESVIGYMLRESIL
jgi:hypothetical protein